MSTRIEKCQGRLTVYFEDPFWVGVFERIENGKLSAAKVTFGAEYEKIVWRDKLPNDQVATVHLLAVSPSYRGRSLGIKLLEEAMKIAVRNGKKALRLDALKTNLPARRMYEKAGFLYRGEQRLYAENTGVTDFLYYEKIPELDFREE